MIILSSYDIIAGEIFGDTYVRIAKNVSLKFKNFALI